MTPAELGIGDPVEIEKPRLHHGEVLDEWVPATVVLVNDWQVVVAYADGRREVVEYRSTHWRRQRHAA